MAVAASRGFDLDWAVAMTHPGIAVGPRADIASGPGVVAHPSPFQRSDMI